MRLRNELKPNKPQLIAGAGMVRDYAADIVCVEHHRDTAYFDGMMDKTKERTNGCTGEFDEQFLEQAHLQQVPSCLGLIPRLTFQLYEEALTEKIGNRRTKVDSE